VIVEGKNIPQVYNLVTVFSLKMVFTDSLHTGVSSLNLIQSCLLKKKPFWKLCKGYMELN